MPNADRLLVDDTAICLSVEDGRVTGSYAVRNLAKPARLEGEVQLSRS